MTETLIARWESKSGKWFADLFGDESGHYWYKGVDCGGNMGHCNHAETAIYHMQTKVNTGYFQPDDNKTPMKRVK